MKLSAWNVAVFAAVCCVASAQSDPKPSPAELSRQATERARNIKLPTILTPTLTDEQRKAMEASADSARNRARTELSRLAEQHPFTEAPPVATASSDNPAVSTASKPLEGRVVVALSSSMPDSELREYMAQLDGKREALVVLRGFIGGAQSVMATGKALDNVMRISQQGATPQRRRVEVVVDPLLYRNLGIDRVPAVVWLPGVSDISHCDGTTFESAVTVYGTASVSYALNQINRNGGAVPADIIKNFGG